MQTEEASYIRKKWGAKPCNHPQVEKEYMLGADTGDKVCRQCGRVFINGNMDDIEGEQTLSKKSAKK